MDNRLQTAPGAGEQDIITVADGIEENTTRRTRRQALRPSREDTGLFYETVNASAQQASPFSKYTHHLWCCYRAYLNPTRGLFARLWLVPFIWPLIRPSIQRKRG